MQTIIGITGPARSGKDTLGKLLVEQFAKQGKTAKTFALADELKRDCEGFIKEKLNLNVWSDVTAEKEVFRPLLIWYAGIKRKQTGGGYWIALLEKKLEQYPEIEYPIITDIRFAEYVNTDEYWWLTENKKGVLIHVGLIDEEGAEILPRIREEKENYFFLRDSADARVFWAHQGGATENNEYLIDEAKTVLRTINHLL